jgi:hypothetical protein
VSKQALQCHIYGLMHNFKGFRPIVRIQVHAVGRRCPHPQLVSDLFPSMYVASHYYIVRLKIMSLKKISCLSQQTIPAAQEIVAASRNSWTPGAHRGEEGLARNRYCSWWHQKPCYKRKSVNIIGKVVGLHNFCASDRAALSRTWAKGPLCTPEYV